MRNLLRWLMPALTVASATAAPVATVTSFGQDPATRRVTVAYTLSERAVVTLDLLTNGVSVGASNLRKLSGDVNRMVGPGPRSIGWQPELPLANPLCRGEVKVVLKAWPKASPPPWMTVDLLVPRGVSYYADAASVPGGIGDVRYRTNKLLLRRIPAANVTWAMGSPEAEKGRTYSYGGADYDNSAAEPQRRVTFTESYYMCVYPVTIRQYERVAGERRGSFRNANDADLRPVECVSYDMIRGTVRQWPKDGHEVDADSFCGKLRALCGVDVDLPTEAQWEFACRAGCPNALYDGHELSGVRSSAYLGDLAWYYHNQPEGARTHAVGELKPNVWGLYDMLGNVREWCLDWYDDPSGDDAVTDPKGPESSPRGMRVTRGGDWAEKFAASLRCASRSGCTPENKSNYNLGFRLVTPASSSWGASASAVSICDVNFGDAAKRIDNDGKEGSFHGVLPTNVNENFASWRKADATSEVRTEDGHRYLRIVNSVGSLPTQFSVLNLGESLSGAYRLSFRARTEQGTVTFRLRQQSSPYTSFWSTDWASVDWVEKSFVFRIDAATAVPMELYINTRQGYTDIEWLRLERVEESALQPRIRRPIARVRQYLRHTRMAFGLPSGWSPGQQFDRAGGVFEFRGEPFQTNRPGEPHVLAFDVVAEHPFTATVVGDGDDAEIACVTFPAASEETRVRVPFTPPGDRESFALVLRGEGEIRFDRFSCRADGITAYDPVCEVAFAAGAGDVADSRIHFLDEEPTVRYTVFNVPSGAWLKVWAEDVYGRTVALDPSPLSAGERVEGAFGAAFFPACPLGSFRVVGRVVDAAGKALSRTEEIVLTRIARPVAWGRDAPDSPFGCHFGSNRRIVRAMKACGVNWVRLHDSATELSCWYALEPKKGEWTFHDEEVALFRDNGIRIFAQLGTTPTWASHYGEPGCTREGYWSHYLRPKDNADFVNYVTTFVARYKGTIDDFFVWNEPWGRFWCEGFDARYYPADRGAEDYAELCKLAYAAAKSANPFARISSYNAASDKSGYEWTDRMQRAGLAPYSDTIDFHVYLNMRCAVDADAEALSKWPVEPVRRDLGEDLGGKEVWMSEGQGTSTGTSRVFTRRTGQYRLTIPFLPETREEYVTAADCTCRFVLQLLSEGVAKVFVYSASGWNGLSARPGFLQLLSSDGYPHPSFAAYSHMTQCLEDKSFFSKRSYGGQGALFSFVGEDGTCTVASGLTRNEILERCRTMGAVATDLFGNRIDLVPAFPNTLVFLSADRVERKTKQKKGQ